MLPRFANHFPSLLSIVTGAKIIAFLHEQPQTVQPSDHKFQVGTDQRGFAADIHVDSSRVRPRNETGSTHAARRVAGHSHGEPATRLHGLLTLHACRVRSRPEFLASAGLKEPGLFPVIRAGYKLLGLLTFFTAGKPEVRAWTTLKGARAPQAAGVIHTDFEKGFIKAEVIWWEDYVKLGGEAKCREAGKLAIEGKEYVMRDGDVVHFRFNV